MQKKIAIKMGLTKYQNLDQSFSRLCFAGLLEFSKR